MARAFCDAWESADEELIEGAASELCAVAARGRIGERAQAFFELRAELPGSSHGERGRNLVRLWRARHRVLPQTLVFKALLERAEVALRASMNRDSVLGYGEVLCAARDILATRPAVAREFGRGLDAFLVDEFQDTSGSSARLSSSCGKTLPTR